MKRILLVLITFAIGQISFGQTPTLQQKLYYTCKVWGFVKYYHSNVSTCHVNWDSVLLHTLPLVRSATTSNQFNDALDTMLLAAGPMALSSTYFPDTLSPALKRNRNWNWIDSSSFRIDVQTILDTIRNNFRPHIGCFVEIDTFGTHSTNLAYTWGGYLEFPYDTTLLNVNTAVSYPDDNHRLLMMFKFWNIVSYFNPYNYIIDSPWDTILSDYVIPIDIVSNSQSLYLLELNIATALNDAHVYGLTYSSAYQTMPGFYQPYIRLKYVDSQYVVTNSLETGIYPGDAIISIDGITTAQWEDSLKQYYSSGNLAVFRRTMCTNMLGRQVDGTSEILVIQDSLGMSHTFNINCINPNLNLNFFLDDYYPADSLASIEWTTMACEVGYVNTSSLSFAGADSVYEALYNTAAVIVDLRSSTGYDGGTEELVYDMIASPQYFSKLTFPDVTYPGTFYWSYDTIGHLGNPNPYNGTVILLINEETQSHTEFYCMNFSAMHNVIKIGSQTAGADGNVTWFSLSNDMRFGYTNLGVFYPDGDSTQRIGIVPDSVVYPTKAGIRHHDDEVLDKALQIACQISSISKINTNNGLIDVFPNPAITELTISASDKITTITVSNVLGQTLYTYNCNSKQVQVNVAVLPKGMYLIRINGSEVRKFVKE